MLVVSHDRYFINRLATRVVKLHKNGIDSYDGNYDYYVEHRVKQNEPAIKKEQKPKENNYKKQKELESFKRRTRGKISRLETEIDLLDERLSSIQSEIALPEASSDYERILALTEELNATTKKQEVLMLQWQELTEELEKLENG